MLLLSLAVAFRTKRSHKFQHLFSSRLNGIGTLSLYCGTERTGKSNRECEVGSWIFDSRYPISDMRYAMCDVRYSKGIERISGVEPRFFVLRAYSEINAVYDEKRIGRSVD